VHSIGLKTLVYTLKIKIILQSKILLEDYLNAEKSDSLFACAHRIVISTLKCLEKFRLYTFTIAFLSILWAYALFIN